MARIVIIAIWLPFSPIFRVFDTLFVFRARPRQSLIWIPFLRGFFFSSIWTASNGSDPRASLLARPRPWLSQCHVLFIQGHLLQWRIQAGAQQAHAPSKCRSNMFYVIPFCIRMFQNKTRHERASKTQELLGPFSEPRRYFLETGPDPIAMVIRVELFTIKPSETIQICTAVVTLTCVRVRWVTHA